MKPAGVASASQTSLKLWRTGVPRSSLPGDQVITGGAAPLALKRSLTSRVSPATMLAARRSTSVGRAPAPAVSLRSSGDMSSGSVVLHSGQEAFFLRRFDAGIKPKVLFQRIQNPSRRIALRIAVPFAGG